MSRWAVPILFVTMGLFNVCFTPPDKLWWLSPGHHALAQTDSSQTPQTPLTVELTFDPDRVAAAEVRMWKAYYDRKFQEVGFELIDLLVRQFHLSAPDALVIAINLSSASLAFQSTRKDYQTQVLPGLRDAYGRLKILTNGAWDAEAAAQAELEWWVKRRTPGHNSQEEVGRSIAKLYTILYGKSNKDIERAGLLRARAAHIRDTGNDWSTIRKLLQESYRLLARGIQ
jgi:hypothetical protein